MGRAVRTTLLALVTAALLFGLLEAGTWWQKRALAQQAPQVWTVPVKRTGALDLASDLCVDYTLTAKFHWTLYTDEDRSKIFWKNPRVADARLDLAFRDTCGSAGNATAAPQLDLEVLVHGSGDAGCLLNEHLVREVPIGADGEQMTDEDLADLPGLDTRNYRTVPACGEEADAGLVLDVSERELAEDVTSFGVLGQGAWWRAEGLSGAGDEFCFQPRLIGDVATRHGAGSIHHWVERRLEPVCMKPMDAVG